MSAKTLKLTTQILLLSVVAVTPFFKFNSLYFPFVSGKVYLFRVLVMLAFFFWVWLLVQNSRFKTEDLRINFRNLLVVSLILLFLAQILVSFFGVDPLFSFFSSISRLDGILQFGFWVLYFLILVSIFKKEDGWKILFSVFIVVAFLVSLFAWLNFPPYQELYGNLFGNPAYFSGFLIFSIGFSLLAFERKFFKSSFLNNLFLALALFFAVSLIFTQIRGALVGLAGGIFLFCFLSVLFLRKTNKKLAHSAGVILLLGVIFLVTLFSFKNTTFIRNAPIISRVIKITDIQEPGSSVRERLLVWEAAFKAFQEKPVFGWGPENFASAFNKHYNHWVGEEEVWFDRAHSTPLDILVGGGISLFLFYLFWLGVVFFLIFRIAKKIKLLSFLLVSIFLAYFLQSLFFFDTFATFIGLFPFLAYLVYLTPRLDVSANQRVNQNSISEYLLLPAVFLSLFVIYATVIMPYRANTAALQFYTHTEAGLYAESKPFLERSFAIKSPYTYWEVRKETGWQFLIILEDKVETTMPLQDIQAIEEIYDLITPELEKFIINKPYEPQTYYVLARIYQSGVNKLGRDDLAKAEAVLKKALNYSDLRKEYFQELKQVLLLQGKIEEAESLLQNYLKRVDFYPHYPYLTMGHFYFEAEDYDSAIEQYEKAKEVGYDFCQIPAEYSRYTFSAEKTGAYQGIVDLAKECLEKWGPDADTYFYIAVGYFYLGDRQMAKEFFLKSVELNLEYEAYRSFFEIF